MASQTNYVCTIDADQAARLSGLLELRGWTLGTAPYARWSARLDKTQVVAFESGKLTVQGRGTPEFVQFLLEPEILKEARFGYETELAEVECPAMFEPHAGIDESGKGDYFGPLVVAAVHVDGASARRLLALGVTDSKAIRSARRIVQLDAAIRGEAAERFSVVAIGPETYNRLHASFGNVNKLLAWGHARALENVLDKVPDCPRAVSDQFGNKQLVISALREKGRAIILEQRPRAESDIAVAAASILARAEFVRRLDALGAQIGCTLPKGAGAAVDAVAADLAATGGTALLGRLAKLHFRTTERAVNATAASVEDTAQ